MELTEEEEIAQRQVDKWAGFYNSLREREKDIEGKW